jgi:hypothetical protein
MINTSKDTIANLLKKNYDQVLDQKVEGNGCLVISDYFGGVSQDVIHTLTEKIEAKLMEIGEAKSTVKKVFAVFIEALQNVFNHGSHDNEIDNLGSCLIFQNSTTVELHFMNLMETDCIPKMKTYLDKLNSLNKDETKELYMQTLSEGELTEKGGAGLGYMTMRLKSLNPINYQFTDSIQNLCGFHYTITIDRKL